MNIIRKQASNEPEIGLKNLHNVRKYFDGNSTKMKMFITQKVQENPLHLVQNPEAWKYLEKTIVEEAAKKILEEYSIHDWMRYAVNLTTYVPIDDVREKILENFSRNPKSLQDSAEKIRELFHEDYFEQKLSQPTNRKQDAIISLLLLFHSFKQLNSYHHRTREILKEKSQYAPMIDAVVLWEKSPFWFSCWWMEENFRKAAKNDEWLCLINGGFFAKFYHANAEALKVTYLPAKTYVAQNWFIIWEDFFYAPTKDDHQKIQKAIKKWQDQLFIPDMQIKAIRPSFGITSEEIVQITKEKFSDSIK